MTEANEHELGNDEQLGPERLAQIEGKLDLELADEIEEERRTEAAPEADDG
jgi:hypothetical protein